MITAPRWVSTGTVGVGVGVAASGVTINGTSVAVGVGVAVTSGAYRKSNKSKLLKFFLAVGLYFSLGTSVYPVAKDFFFGSGGSSFQSHQLQGVVIQKASSGEENVLLERKSVELQELQSEYLFLNFDSTLRSGRAGFGIDVARYRNIKGNNIVGMAASFEQPKHGIDLEPPEYLFTERKDHIGDFSIYLRFKPYERKNRMDILRKGGVFEGKLTAMYLYLENGQAVFSFRNIFSLGNVSAENVLLRTRTSVSSEKFNELLLTYNEAKGEMTVYLNGIEQDKIFVTVNGKSGATTLLGKFHAFDGSRLQIGRGFLGAIDEMLLANAVVDPATGSGHFGKPVKLAGRMDVDKGVFTSPRYDIGYSASSILKVLMNTEIPAGTRLKFFIRYSNLPFKPDTPDYELPFRPWRAMEVSARFFQYRIELFSDASGRISPRLKSLHIATRQNLPPAPPQGLAVIDESIEQITLSFFRNPELDVIKGGRYHIYYGLTQDKPLGVIRYARAESLEGGGSLLKTINDKDFRLTGKDTNRLQITITNEMIEQNIVYTRNKPELRFEYPLLQGDIPYYFWVTACDSAYDEAPELRDHESKRSNVVIARPR